jgi:cytidylate kinase
MSIIAISRGTFSGGEAIARAVADRLGYRCVSREVVLEAAWAYGIPAEELIDAMEKRPPLWQRVTGERSDHITFVRAALCEHARGGKLVYHGYVGHLFLPGISHVIGVRVIADMEFRVTAAMRQRNLTQKEAVSYIEKVDKERRQWTRFLFDVDWDDPSLFDVVLNLGRMSIATACDAVVRLTERDEFKPTANSTKAMQNLALSSRVAAVLARDPRTRGAVVQVTANDGVVTVTGTTQSPSVLEAIPAAVRQVEGVTDVRNEVRFLREGTAGALG